MPRRRRRQRGTVAGPWQPGCTYTISVRRRYVDETRLYLQLRTSCSVNYSVAWEAPVQLGMIVAQCLELHVVSTRLGGLLLGPDVGNICVKVESVREIGIKLLLGAELCHIHTHRMGGNPVVGSLSQHGEGPLDITARFGDDLLADLLDLLERFSLVMQ